MCTAHAGRDARLVGSRAADVAPRSSIPSIHPHSKGGTHMRTLAPLAMMFVASGVASTTAID